MYTVKITTKCEGCTITEIAGLRGMKTIVSVEGPDGLQTNRRPHKIEGWKTEEGALQFISSEFINAVKKGRISTFEVEAV